MKNAAKVKKNLEDDVSTSQFSQSCSTFRISNLLSPSLEEIDLIALKANASSSDITLTVSKTKIVLNHKICRIMFSILKPRWKNPNPAIREQATRSLKDEAILLQLALGDVSESVRKTAVKSLSSNNSLYNVAQDGTCEATRLIAINRLEEDINAIQELCKDPLSDEFLVTRIIERFGERLDQVSLLKAAQLQVSPPIKLAIARILAPSESCHTILDEQSSDELITTLTPKILNSECIKELSSTKHSKMVRMAAIPRLQDEESILRICREDNDSDIRHTAVNLIPNDHPSLKELLACEDNDTCRAALCGKLTDEASLLSLIMSERSREVRASAARKLKSHEPIRKLIENKSIEFEIRLETIDRLSDEEILFEICLSNEDERIQLAALDRIDNHDTIKKLLCRSETASVKWAASRKLGQVDLKSFWKIENEIIVEDLTKKENDPDVANYLIRRINQQSILKEISESPTVAATAAHLRINQSVGPKGIRFTPINGRPYEMSTFFLTRGEVDELLKNPVKPSDPQFSETPAIGLTLQDINTICARLNGIEARNYRLPTFDEWEHACNPTRYLDKNSKQDTSFSTGIHLGAQSPRSRIYAIQSDTGILDPIGNVLTLLSDESIKECLIQRLAPCSPLATASISHPYSVDEFAFAAGNHWEEARVTPGRFEHFLWQHDANSNWKDKVGIRLLRDRAQKDEEKRDYRIILEPNPREGYEKEEVIRTAAKNLILSVQKVRDFFQHAPIEVLSTTDYEHAKNQRRCWQRSGAKVVVR